VLGDPVAVHALGSAIVILVGLAGDLAVWLAAAFYVQFDAIPLANLGDVMAATGIPDLPDSAGPLSGATTCNVTVYLLVTDDLGVMQDLSVLVHRLFHFPARTSAECRKCIWGICRLSSDTLRLDYCLLQCILTNQMNSINWLNDINHKMLERDHCESHLWLQYM
jgi:hypothetical protein